MFHEVLDFLLTLAQSNLRMPRAEIQPRIQDDSRMSPFFDNCLGAIDGSHFATRVPVEQARSYRNRKGWTSLNVLTTCDLDGRIAFVLPGWEGSASDSKVFLDAVTRNLLVIPEVAFCLPTLATRQGVGFLLRIVELDII